MAQTATIHTLALRRGRIDRSEQAREFLRVARLRVYDFDPQEIAALAGVSRSTIYAFRAGRTLWPRPHTLFPILDAIGYRITLEKTE